MIVNIIYRKDDEKAAEEEKKRKQTETQKKQQVTTCVGYLFKTGLLNATRVQVNKLKKKTILHSTRFHCLSTTTSSFLFFLFHTLHITRYRIYIQQTINHFFVCVVFLFKYCLQQLLFTGYTTAATSGGVCNEEGALVGGVKPNTAGLH